jgi:hypothetical protein
MTNTKKLNRLHLAARFLDVALGYLAARTCELHGWLLNWRVIECNPVVMATLWILFSVALIWVTNRLHKLAPGDHKDKTLHAWNELARRNAKDGI